MKQDKRAVDELTKTTVKAHTSLTDEHVSIGKVGVVTLECSIDNFVGIVVASVVVKKLLKVSKVISISVVAGTHASVGVRRESLDGTTVVVVGFDNIGVGDGSGNIVNVERTVGNQTCAEEKKQDRVRFRFTKVDAIVQTNRLYS